MAKIQISDLLLRTIIGTHDWERKNRQEVVINITLDYDSRKARQKDDIEQTVDYKTITKTVIREVEASKFLLLESLTDFVLKLIMKNPKVKTAVVRVDKPHALRFARSVSVELSAKRK